MNILITGGNGYIAKSLFKSLREFHYVHLVTRKDFDLTNREATDNWFKGKHFGRVIHTAIKGGSRLKEDSSEIVYQNILMFYNLLNNRHCYESLINFGTGAEVGLPTDPYGLSKSVIDKLIQNEPNLFNVRIFGVFDEGELNTRFIKSNINKYINKEPLVIHQNKYMDFFYMKDLIKIIDLYIARDHRFERPPKNFDCSYKNKYTLLDIANFINNLSDYKCEIKTLNNDLDKSYVGKNKDIPYLEYKGLEQGIKEVYNKLK